MFQSKRRYSGGGSPQDPNTLYDDQATIDATSQKGDEYRAAHHQNIADEKADKEDKERLRLLRIQEEKDRQAAMDNVGNKASEGVQIQGALSDSQITSQPATMQTGNPTGALNIKDLSFESPEQDIAQVERDEMAKELELRKRLEAKRRGVQPNFGGYRMS